MADSIVLNLKLDFAVAFSSDDAGDELVAEFNQAVADARYWCCLRTYDGDESHARDLLAITRGFVELARRMHACGGDVEPGTQPPTSEP